MLIGKYGSKYKLNILFLTLIPMEDLGESGIYHDLMRKFCDEDHRVFAVYPVERRVNAARKTVSSGNYSSLGVKTLNIQKTNIIEKSISTLFISHLFKTAILQAWPGISYDLIIYSTPPITFTRAINYFKKRDLAMTYLLLKDIFPQNAVDLGIINKNSILHRYLVRKENELYNISDHIGCMSPANVKFINTARPELSVKTEVNPNSINIAKICEPPPGMREKYSIPEDALVFIYGGNLGKPQGVGFLLETLNTHKSRSELFFLIIGSGTEFNLIKNNIEKNNIANAMLISALPKNEYERVLAVSDVGLIFLDHRFTIPNFPSRLLSYLQYKKPVLAATDQNSDIGDVIENNGFGLWAQSGDLEMFSKHVSYFIYNKSNLTAMGQKGYDFLVENYTTDVSYRAIMKHFKT